MGALSHLAGAPRPVPVGVDQVVPGRGVVVVLVDVVAGHGVVVGRQVGVGALDPVVEDGDGHALAGDALLPRGKDPSDRERERVDPEISIGQRN